MAKEFRSSDLAFSAYLALKGIKLLRVETISSGRGYFIFEDSSQREDLSRTYLEIGSQVDPVKYLQSIKMLKGMATNTENN